MAAEKLGTGNESSGASIGSGWALRRIDSVKRVLDLELEGLYLA
jgi:hypothetical protein